MATQSTVPSPAHVDENPQKPVPELSKPVEEDGREVKQDAAVNESSRRSVFAISEPMREEQVQNAVKFLSHPKVRGSPIIYRRSFLERKGLTKEEIDEAFRHVPDPPANVPSVEANTANQAGFQPQVLSQTMQPASAPASGAAMDPSLQQAKFHWSHAFLGVGVLAASGVGTAFLFKNMVIPRLKTWIQKVVAEQNDVKRNDISSPSPAEEATEAAKAATSAAAIVAKASQELLNAKNEEKKYFEEFMGMLDVQVEEMKSMGNAIRKLEKRRELINSEAEHKSLNEAAGANPWSKHQVNQSNPSVSAAVSKHVKANGAQVMNFGAVRPSSAPASTELSMPPHPKSYIEIMEMIQRGERPPNIKEINDMPPNPNQPIPRPLVAPRRKPWECAQQAGFQSQASSQGLSSEVKEITQLNVRTDGSEPWWRKNTVKITEIESEADESEKFSYQMGANERPNHQVWVPPQPPAVVMPEAAAAIQQPKSSIQEEVSVDERSITLADNGENQRVRASDMAAESENCCHVMAETNQSGTQE